MREDLKRPQSWGPSRSSGWLAQHRPSAIRLLKLPVRPLRHSRARCCFRPGAEAAKVYVVRMITRSKVRTWSSLLLGLGAAVATVSLVAVGTAAAQQRVVLGSASYPDPNSRGFGSAHPRAIYNGGDASGSVFDIRWSSWGGRTALGVGKNPIFKPNGGYYPQPVTIQLHAVALGHCSPGAPPAYERLYVREPGRPGGPLGKWFSWSGRNSLCRAPSF
jgi:hypothetical protein